MEIKLVKAIDLKKGDEFFYQGERYRITINEDDQGERKIWTYCVERPLTKALLFWWANDREVEIVNV